MKNTIPFGFEKDGKLYLNAWSEHPERAIGEVRDDDVQKSVAFFTERYDDLKSSVEDVAGKIDASENKGSFLMKLLHLKELLPAHDGLGDYQLLHDKISQYESLVKDIIKKNRERNTEIKKALIIEARDAVEAINWKEGTEKVNDLKSRWIKTGNAAEDQNELLEADFWELIKGFFERKKNFYEDKQKLLDHRRKKYEELVKEASSVGQLHGKSKAGKIKELRESWKNTGGIPNDLYKPLNEKFNELLKQRNNSSGIDYTEILSSLEEVKKGIVPFDKKELGRIKKSVYGDRSRNNEKGRVIELIQLLIERDFVNKLTNKRFPDFEKLEAEKKKSIRLGIVRDLLSRDKEDLKIYEENSANFNSPYGSVNTVVENRLKGQRRKIDIKMKLIEWIEGGEFNF